MSEFSGGRKIRVKSYSSNWPNDESPVSDGSRWTNGLADGLDWCNMVTTGGLIYGTQTGNAPGSGHPDYNDSVAILKGTWNPNHAVEAKVKTINQDNVLLNEVELWLRGSITSHSIQGYECTFSVRSSGYYTSVVRWNGPLSSFDVLGDATPQHINDGDIIMATISGTTITLYKNGSSFYTVETTAIGGATYSTGNPGLGHWVNKNGGPSFSNTDLGFTMYRAWNL